MTGVTGLTGLTRESNGVRSIFLRWAPHATTAGCFNHWRRSPSDAALKDRSVRHRIVRPGRARNRLCGAPRTIEPVRAGCRTTGCGEIVGRPVTAGAARVEAPLKVPVHGARRWHQTPWVHGRARNVGCGRETRSWWQPLAVGSDSSHFAPRGHLQFRGPTAWMVGSLLRWSRMTVSRR